MVSVPHPYWKTYSITSSPSSSSIGLEKLLRLSFYQYLSVCRLSLLKQFFIWRLEKELFLVEALSLYSVVVSFILS